MSVEKSFEWERPENGDGVRICQWRGIGDPVIKWDGERYGFSVGGGFRNMDGDIEYRELAFLSEDDLDEERFVKKTD